MTTTEDVDTIPAGRLVVIRFGSGHEFEKGAGRRVNQFVKIYGSIIRSTVWQTKPHIKLTWLTMLILADSEGRVEGSIPGLAATTGVSIEQVEEALECFRSPDKYSRTKDNDGRRIEDIRGGWRVLNHNLYRDMRTETQQKQARRQQKYREKKTEKVKAAKRKAPAPKADPPEPSPAVTRRVTKRNERDALRSDDENRSELRVSRADPDPDLPGLPPCDPPHSKFAESTLSGSTDLDLVPTRDRRDLAGRAVDFGDVQPATCKVPRNYVELDEHRQSAREFGLDLAGELERFRLHEYPRPYSDFHARFGRWLLDGRVRAETENFQRSQRKAPRAGVLQTQPSNGATGWEGVDDDGDDRVPPAKATGS
jgi:hypothetical protein